MSVEFVEIYVARIKPKGCKSKLETNIFEARVPICASNLGKVRWEVCVGVTTANSKRATLAAWLHCFAVTDVSAVGRWSKWDELNFISKSEMNGKFFRAVFDRRAVTFSKRVLGKIQPGWQPGPIAVWFLLDCYTGVGFWPWTHTALSLIRRENPMFSLNTIHRNWLHDPNEKVVLRDVDQCLSDYCSVPNSDLWVYFSDKQKYFFHLATEVRIGTDCARYFLDYEWECYERRKYLNHLPQVHKDSKVEGDTIRQIFYRPRVEKVWTNGTEFELSVRVI